MSYSRQSRPAGIHGKTGRASVIQTTEEVDAVKNYKTMATVKVVRRTLAMTALCVIGVLCAVVVTVGPANAYNAAVQTISGGGNPPCPPAADGTAQACVTSLTFTGVVLGGKASASDIDSGMVTVLADMNLRAGVKVNAKNCFWTKKGQVWYSGGWGASGKVFQRETTPALLCRSSKSSTGWVKVKGGMTGRPCFNEAKVGSPPGPVVTGKVVWVHTFANLRLNLLAHAHVDLTAVCGHASADGTAKAVVHLREFIRTRGNIQGRLRMAGGAVGIAVANAKADIHCDVPTPGPTTTVVVTTPAPPPPTTTNTVTTTITQTTTTTTTTPPPVQHTCSLSVPLTGKLSDSYFVNATVGGDNVAPSSITWDWGNGAETTPATGVSTSRTHNYPIPPAGPAGFVQYVIDVHADFGSQKGVPCGMVAFNVPIPPQSGTTTIPPQP